MQLNMSKHLFAIYLENLSFLLSNKQEEKTFLLDDATLKNRLTKILRIKPSEEFILFDEFINARFLLKLTPTNKKTFCVELLSKQENLAIEPSITLYLPILKKEAFEYAIYIAAQMGVTTIIPVATEKGVRELPKHDRLQKIMIAACEQSKNFVIPKLEQPQVLRETIEVSGKINSHKICFDENGAPAHELMQKLVKNKNNKIIITLGPESGFSESEKEELKKAGFSFYRLTPTILRSREAIAVGLGMVRSLG